MQPVTQGGIIFPLLYVSGPILFVFMHGDIFKLVSCFTIKTISMDLRGVLCVYIYISYIFKDIYKNAKDM